MEMVSRPLPKADCFTVPTTMSTSTTTATWVSELTVSYWASVSLACWTETVTFLPEAMDSSAAQLHGTIREPDSQSRVLRLVGFGDDRGAELGSAVVQGCRDRDGRRGRTVASTAATATGRDCIGG